MLTLTLVLEVTAAQLVELARALLVITALFIT
jgi:hypothetical protein